MWLLLFKKNFFRASKRRNQKAFTPSLGEREWIWSELYQFHLANSGHKMEIHLGWISSPCIHTHSHLGFFWEVDGKPMTEGAVKRHFYPLHHYTAVQWEFIGNHRNYIAVIGVRANKKFIKCLIFACQLISCCII